MLKRKREKLLSISRKDFVYSHWVLCDDYVVVFLPFCCRKLQFLSQNYLLKDSYTSLRTSSLCFPV